MYLFFAAKTTRRQPDKMSRRKKAWEKPAVRQGFVRRSPCLVLVASLLRRPHLKSGCPDCKNYFVRENQTNTKKF